MDYSQYIAHLVRYPSFTTGESTLPRFLYASADEENLRSFREQYDLEQTAGDGNGLSRVLRVMQWVHDELSQRGDRVTIQPLTPVNILETCRHTRCRLFCFHKAIVFTEALLALGIRARRLTCLPFEFDGDCHVVTMAFLPEFEKWALFDPSFNTFFTNEAGMPLSLPEIRSRYRENCAPTFQHIAMAKDGDVAMAGVVCETYDEWYAAYMAKNCFRFFCPLTSEYGQAFQKEEYVFLDPVGFAERNLYDADKTTAYRTDNITHFLGD